MDFDKLYKRAKRKARKETANLSQEELRKIVNGSYREMCEQVTLRELLERHIMN